MTATVAPLNLDSIHSALDGNVAAFRLVTHLEPAGGYDKVFPPTYEKGAYARERRRIGDHEVDAVVLDSVQSQANRFEEALLRAWREGTLKFPVLRVDFTPDFPDIQDITSLDAPHRIADAIIRDSLLNGKPFRESEEGKAFTNCSQRNATPLFELCPTACFLGVWDSTGPRGGLGVKFARALVSEVVALDVVYGVKTASRIDPLQIPAGITIYESASQGWTLNPDEAVKDDKGKAKLKVGKEGKGGKPSAVNHSNVTPTVSDVGGGVTLKKAVQTVVLSLPVLRRLEFPAPGKDLKGRNRAARTMLTALALAAVTLQRERDGYDFRSRCTLAPVSVPQGEIVHNDGSPPTPFSLTAEQAIALCRQAGDEVRKQGFAWRESPIELKAAPKLIELLRRRNELAVAGGAEE